MIIGFVDMHSHPMAHLGFGGRLLWGSPEQPVEQLRRCDGRGHGAGIASGQVLHTLEEATGLPDDQHPTGDWPTFSTRAHQQVHLDWLRRAHAGGLRVVCALAVTNGLLDSLMGDQPVLAHGVEDDHTVALRQIDAMTAAANASSWMQIARSPYEAREIAARGKLAVVLGLEVDQLGGWVSEGDCTDAQVEQMVDGLARRGVSYVIPIHLVNNAFGGCAVYSDAFNTLNKYLTGDYYSVEDGAATGITFRLSDRPSRAVFGFIHPWVEQEDVAISEYNAVPADHGHRNTVGLTGRGRTLLHALMRHGILIDIDHMSEKAADETLTIAEFQRYPLVSGHTGFRELALPPGAHESLKTRQQVERIAALGGMVAPITIPADVRDVGSMLPGVAGLVANDCAGSVKSWAQSYLYAVEVMGARGVALGSDFNGLAQTCGPRFGAHAAYGLAGTDEARRDQQRAGQVAGVEYAQYGDPVVLAAVETRHPGVTARLRGANPPLVGDGLRDVNVDGLAHAGMLPDFLQDLANIGVDAERRRPLMTSAEHFLQTWETCVGRGRNLS